MMRWTSRFGRASKTPSEASRSQSPGAQSSARKTSGIAVTLVSSWARWGSFSTKSPNPRLTAR
eukprot:1774926-Alexandrium_andersonii.AAC.1